MTDSAFAPGSGEVQGLFDRERIVANAGFNRWLVPPAALCIHLCIGMAYGFSVFWLPLSQAIGIGKPVACPDMGTLGALFTTSCDWKVADLGWMFTLFFVLLGSSAAIWGGWLERVGPRRAGFVSALCWCGGLLISALGVYIHQLWMLWVGSGVIGGIGLGIGYISPVSTLIKWFPDRRGMATGMAIMGFGGGAMIGSPLADILMNYFKTPTSVGVWQTFVVMAGIYFAFMMAGAFGYRIPPANWRPEGWTPPATQNAMITSGHVALENAHKTPQFWLIWAVLCLNVSAGIGVLGMASPMLQEIFAGKLIGRPEIAFAALDPEQRQLVATIAAAFVGLLSLFNIGGRFFWASMSDKLGRKLTFSTFFGLGIVLYGLSPWAASIGSLALFVAFFCIILSMYGGGFATVPAYLADMFGTQFVGAIHGRLLTAWSTAGIVGPVVVNYIREAQISAGVPRAQVYDRTMYILAGMLVAGFIANLLVRPVAAKWFMKDAEVAALQAKSTSAAAQYGSYGIGKGGLSGPALLAWAVVGLPLAWGVWITLTKSLALFR
ncbi:OFA family MFS transporter [Chelatococcus asaccharovorans]|uniref:MFS transporter n=1 Tax=Chelatococcus asaccharovorans TaxID=28210 RepID=A0A2V3TXL0_9HYPH|nr:OFA family MFS transporter [Chelatococcus asaccharovorans]MBS7705101.1 OFA family MFS transporter [Chelatococcus asaccharovorans]PXW53592.1 MFS transporter [Chelatococcus asaccharovorans]